MVYVYRYRCENKGACRCNTGMCSTYVKMTCGTMMAQGYGGRVEGALTANTLNMRTAGVRYLSLPNLTP